MVSCSTDSHLTEALEANPGNVDYVEFMGVLLHQTGNWEDAAEYLERAVATDRQRRGTAGGGGSGGGGGGGGPEYDQQQRQELGVVDEETFFNLGVVYKDLDRNQAAAHAFATAYELVLAEQQPAGGAAGAAGADSGGRPMLARSRPELKAATMKYLALTVEHAAKACDWATFGSKWPVFAGHLARGDEVSAAAANHRFVYSC
eukprot:SAG22_NODE_77_length_22125_cov_46.140016_24_plen_203_part_00